MATSGGVDSSAMLLKLKEQKLEKKIKYLLHWTCGDLYDEQHYAKSSISITGVKTLNKNFLV